MSSILIKPLSVERGAALFTVIAVPLPSALFPKASLLGMDPETTEAWNLLAYRLGFVLAYQGQKDADENVKDDYERLCRRFIEVAQKANDVQLAERPAKPAIVCASSRGQDSGT